MVHESKPKALATVDAACAIAGPSAQHHSHALLRRRRARAGPGPGTLPFVQCDEWTRRCSSLQLRLGYLQKAPWRCDLNGLTESPGSSRRPSGKSSGAHQLAPLSNRGVCIPSRVEDKLGEQSSPGRFARCTPAPTIDGSASATARHHLTRNFLLARARLVSSCREMSPRAMRMPGLGGSLPSAASERSRHLQRQGLRLLRQLTHASYSHLPLEVPQAVEFVQEYGEGSAPAVAPARDLALQRHAYTSDLSHRWR